MECKPVHNLMLQKYAKLGRGGGGGGSVWVGAPPYNQIFQPFLAQTLFWGVTYLCGRHIFPTH
jgi:hypothetical protein